MLRRHGCIPQLELHGIPGGSLHSAWRRRNIPKVCFDGGLLCCSQQTDAHLLTRSGIIIEGFLGGSFDPFIADDRFEKCELLCHRVERKRVEPWNSGSVRLLGVSCFQPNHFAVEVFLFPFVQNHKFTAPPCVVNHGVKYPPSPPLSLFPIERPNMALQD